eukprot:2208346-Prorocentrum_lima.AAC.1
MFATVFILCIFPPPTVLDDVVLDEVSPVRLEIFGLRVDPAIVLRLFLGDVVLWWFLVKVVLVVARVRSYWVLVIDGLCGYVLRRRWWSWWDWDNLRYSVP